MKDEGDDSCQAIGIGWSGMMGLLDKINPKATTKSVFIHGIIGAIVGCVFFLLFFKTQWKQEWKILLPLWMLLCAGASALCEWQIDDSDEDGDNDEESLGRETQQDK